MNLTGNAGVGMQRHDLEATPPGRLFCCSVMYEETALRIFLIGGSPEARQPARLAPVPGELVIAADHGAAHARAWSWPLHLLVGDLDSLGTEEEALVAAGGVPIITAPAAKDETDLELALAHALAQGASEIIICAALGGRSDHMLANVLLLARPELADLAVTLVDGRESIRLLRGGSAAAHLELLGAPGDLLSLLPLGCDAVGVTTDGLQYPLHDETLFLGQARGVSNLFTSARADITLRCGLLLVFHTIADG
jgi:thiamine pyrophosphokinase